MSPRELFAWRELAEINKSHQSAHDVQKGFIAAHGDKQSVERIVSRLMNAK